MAEMTRVALDAMGGDNAPVEMVKGAVDAVNKEQNVTVLLVGIEEIVREELGKYSYDKERIPGGRCNQESIHRDGRTPGECNPQEERFIHRCRNEAGKDRGEADAFVSAGSSGAILVGGQTLVGRIRGIERPPLGTVDPDRRQDVSLLIDCGANVDARPSHLVQFAKMGSIYMEHVVGDQRTREVAIVNIGAEEEKGNALVKGDIPTVSRNAERYQFYRKYRSKRDPSRRMQM